MKIELATIADAIQAVTFPPDAVFAEACASLDLMGWPAELFSAGPLDRFMSYLRNELFPRIRACQEEFDDRVLKVAFAVEQELARYRTDAARFVAEVTDQASEKTRDLFQYLEDMKAEGLAGPKTARIAVLVGTCEAIRKILLTWPPPNFTEIGSPDLLMIALGYLLVTNDPKSTTSPPSEAP